MSFAKLAPAVAFATLTLTACGISPPPVAGTPSRSGKPIGRGRIDDQRANKPNRIACLRSKHLSVVPIGNTELQVGSAHGGPTIVFEPTPGVAQGDLIQGFKWAQGAETIGSALVYPNQAPDGEMAAIEACLAQGVTG